MIRTQIQLPDELYRSSKEIAARLEISLAELVRRGLEYVVAVSPKASSQTKVWHLPDPQSLGAKDPFQHADWREQIHIDRLRAAEERADYGAEEADK